MAVIRPSISAALLLACLGWGACLGCGVKERLNGVYVGYQAVGVAKGTDPVVAKQLRTVKLVAKPDGTADLSIQGVPVEGHIEYGIADATFVPDSVTGVPIDQQSAEIVQKFTVKLKPVTKDEWMFGDSILLDRVP